MLAVRVLCPVELNFSTHTYTHTLVQEKEKESESERHGEKFGIPTEFSDVVHVKVDFSKCIQRADRERKWE